NDILSHRQRAPPGRTPIPVARAQYSQKAKRKETSRHELAMEQDDLRILGFLGRKILQSDTRDPMLSAASVQNGADQTESMARADGPTGTRGWLADESREGDSRTRVRSERTPRDGRDAKGLNERDSAGAVRAVEPPESAHPLDEEGRDEQPTPCNAPRD